MSMLGVRSLVAAAGVGAAALVGAGGCGDDVSPLTSSAPAAVSISDPRVRPVKAFTGAAGTSRFAVAAAGKCRAAVGEVAALPADGAIDDAALASWAEQAAQALRRLDAAIAELAQQRPESAEQLGLLRRVVWDAQAESYAFASASRNDPGPMRLAMASLRDQADAADLHACALVLG